MSQSRAAISTSLRAIITFMSILELMKVGAIVIRQEKTFGEIVIDSLDDIDAVIEPMTVSGISDSSKNEAEGEE